MFPFDSGSNFERLRYTLLRWTPLHLKGTEERDRWGVVQRLLVQKVTPVYSIWHKTTVSAKKKSPLLFTISKEFRHDEALFV